MGGTSGAESAYPSGWYQRDKQNP